MNKAVVGVLLALLFILLEAVQTVYFGGLFQRMSAFLFGALVFGATFVVCVAWSALKTPDALRGAVASPLPLLGVNLCALMTFGCFLLSVQLIEPAITYTISAGTMPIATYLLHKLGVREGEGMRNRIEATGNLLLFVGIVYLGVMTIDGQTGFVRGDTAVAIAGVALAVADGVFFTLILIFSSRLDKAGVGPFTVLGLRMPLYVVVAGSLAALGVDAKEALTASQIALFVAVGLLLTVPPLYFLQKAVSMVSTLTISSLTALGPFVIFSLQMIEGRVDYSWATLFGISVYSLASILAAVGAVRAATKGPVRASHAADHAGGRNS